MNPEEERYGVGQNSGDPQQAKESKKRDKRNDRLKKNDLVVLLGDRKNRKIIWDWMKACYVFDVAFNPNPQCHAYNEGMRAAGLMIRKNVILAGPELMAKMEVEALEDEERGYGG